MRAVRRSGTLHLAHRAGPSDHGCWSYATDAERAAAVVAWLTGGVQLGQRAMYVADLPERQLIGELTDLPGRDHALVHGALRIARTSDVYDVDAPTDPLAQLDFYSTAVNEAIADGYTGVRVAADVTPLVAHAARRHAHLRWEQLVDRYMTDHPLSALCLIDRSEVDNFPAVEHVHPLGGPDALPFRFHAATADRSAVSGEIDALTAGPLAECIAALPDADDALVVSELDFVDAHSAWLLAAALEQRNREGRRVVLEDAQPLVRRVWTACGFDAALLN
jgi:anti-anti-sigma factor